MSITEKLDKFKQENNYNKADVARLSGIPYTTIDGLYKKGGENTKLSTLRKLANFIGCTIDELTDNTTAKDSRYNLYPETAELVKALSDNPNLRNLMDASRKLAPDDVKNIADIVAKMKKKENHEDD